ncbi:MAG: DUF4292 domain-containing protein [Bacteroidetes bacterium]|nr:DUF4292 domain-containing protein [Bacteroidota bacterium]
MNLNIKLLILFLGFIASSELRAQGNSLPVELSKVDSKINQLIVNRPDFFYSKIQTSIIATEPEFGADLRLSTRVKKDSLIFANVSYMGIQAASVHLTKDKGHLLNRLSNCYMEGDAKLVSNFTGVDLELLELEELILGLPLYYTKLDKQNIRTTKDSLQNIKVTYLGNIRSTSSEQKWVDITYLFDDSLTYMKQLNLSIPKDSTSMIWKCEEFQDNSGYRVPAKVSIVINRLKSIMEVELKYNSVEINVPEKIEFDIPKNYEKCN